MKNKFLFSSLLVRHVGAATAWTVLPIMLMEYFGAELYQVSMVYVANTLTAFSCHESDVKENSDSKYNKIQDWDRNDSHSICWTGTDYRVVDGNGHLWP